MAKGFRDLIVWQKSIDFCVFVYKITAGFPDCEKYALTSQIRRAVASIAANIAEGHGRRFKKEFVRFLCIALGSSSELESHLELAFRLKYISNTELNLATESNDAIRRMTTALIKKIQDQPTL